MPVSPERELENVYSAIGEVLTDAEIELLVKQATGKDLYVEYCAPDDPRKVKIRRTVEALKREGNERWLLTYVLIYVAAHERLRQKWEKLGDKIVRAFPGTLINLPVADNHVETALSYLQKVLHTPFPPPLKAQLRPKQRSLSEIVRSIVALFAYKSLHECLLTLLFTSNYTESLLVNPVDQVEPGVGCIARQMEGIVKQAPTALALLGAAAASERSAWVDRLTSLSASLQAAADSPNTALQIVDEIQRLLRVNLSRLNGIIFKAVQQLSFEPLMADLPSDIEERNEFNELRQAIRDLMATIVARTLKHKMWQDAENQMSLVGSYFSASVDATEIAQDWFPLSSRVNWLSELETDELWFNQAKNYAAEIDTEMCKAAMCKEGELDDNVRKLFESYRRWFRGPFKKMDEALTRDCGSLRKMDNPLAKILNELDP